MEEIGSLGGVGIYLVRGRKENIDDEYKMKLHCIYSTQSQRTLKKREK